MYRNLDINSIVYSYMDTKKDLFEKLINDKLNELNVEILINDFISTKINREIDNAIIKSIRCKFDQTIENTIFSIINEKHLSDESVNKLIKQSFNKADIKKYIKDRIIKNLTKECEEYEISIVKIKREYD